MEEKDDDARRSPSAQSKTDQGETENKRVLQLVMEFAMSENFEKDFEDFAASHKDSFLKILIMDEGAEHPMEWHDIYMDYLRTFEGKIERFISSKGFEITDFYEECKTILEDDDAVFGETRFFLEALLATSEYQTFISLMKGEMLQFAAELDNLEPSSPKASSGSPSSGGHLDRLDSKGEVFDSKEDK